MGAVILTSNHDIPSNLDDAISIIKRNTPVEEISSIKSMTEEKFSALAHFGFGMHIRNTWSLWWSTALAEQYRDKNYPQTKPAIVEFFNNLGIYHADDMSGIVVTTFYRDINGIDINLLVTTHKTTFKHLLQMTVVNHGSSYKLDMRFQNELECVNIR